MYNLIFSKTVETLRRKARGPKKLFMVASCNMREISIGIGRKDYSGAFLMEILSRVEKRTPPLAQLR